MINKILIANRGEIACRIARTARRLGIRVVAVYSDADANARHVELATEAVRIGPAPASESYLDIDALIDAAKRTRADAIHPGYGFLSENATFAERCAKENLIFIGPKPDAIRMMASKSVSREVMRNAGVPVLPGYEGADQSIETLRGEAEKIGFPLLIKAVSGGGGKGMRVVHAMKDLDDAVSAARREAESAFADDQVLLEAYLERPRHIEVQVFGDSKGNLVHLFDRDCSIQRRYQKIVEEAPAPELSMALRRNLREAALLSAQAIDYVGAGTVEFLVEKDQAWFMEMNTRLQVEHPVTEMITREDLVEWQIIVANGEALPKSQEQLQAVGHAIEARVYAENPNRDFLPATGKLNYADFATGELDVRVDTGVRSGDEIGIHYDPMLAKVVAWDEDRSAALARLTRALDATHLTGVTTNLEFLKNVLRFPLFRKGAVTTTFIEENKGGLLGLATAMPSDVLALFSLAELVRRAKTARDIAKSQGDPWSPWALTGNWRLNMDFVTRVRLGTPDNMLEVNAYETSEGIRLHLPGQHILASKLTVEDQRLSVALDGHRIEATVIHDDGGWTVFHDGQQFRLDHYQPAETDQHTEHGGGSLIAPMPGLIIDVLVSPGDHVEAGAILVIMEAMKMEHAIKAPVNGTISAVNCARGQTVDDGLQLVEMQNDDTGAAD